MQKKSGHSRFVSCLIGLLRRSLMTLALLQAGLKVWQIIRIAHIDLNGQLLLAMAKDRAEQRMIFHGSHLTAAFHRIILPALYILSFRKIPALIFHIHFHISCACA